MDLFFFFFLPECFDRRSKYCVSLGSSNLTGKRVLIEVVPKPENLQFVVSRFPASDFRPEFCKWSLNLNEAVF